MLAIFWVTAMIMRSASCQAEIGLCSHVCQMYQQCSNQCEQESAVSHTQQIRTGKAGPIGPPGPPGTPGVVDYTLINETIDNRIEELESRIQTLEQLLTWSKARNGYFYKVFPTLVNYARAKRVCMENGGILASVGPRDSGVRQHLAYLMKPYGQAWIGVTDIAREGTWVWEDGVVSDGNDIDWITSPRQPDNTGGNEDCAHMLASYNWKVNDHQCTMRFPALCEKRPE